MNDTDLIKGIASVLKNTESEIKQLKDGKSFEVPVNNELVKTLKAMAYEDVCSLVQKYIKAKKV